MMLKKISWSSSILAGFLLLCLLPVLIVICLSLLISGHEDVIFLQRRFGRELEEFTIYKFQTYIDGQVTPFGRFLRAYSLDELPQLVNILCGQMRFIGPRPLPTQYRVILNDQQKVRCQVPSGLTGLAQVMGGNSLSWQERFRYDLFYVKHQSVALDTLILLKTFRQLFKAKKHCSSILI